MAMLCIKSVPALKGLMYLCSVDEHLLISSTKYIAGKKSKIICINYNACLRLYLRELLSLSGKQRTRASGTTELIRTRSSKTKARAFYAVAPYLWNSLSADLRTAETYSAKH